MNRAACPDWPALLDEQAGGDGGERVAALAHLEGCTACRRVAYAVDPTLIFRRLPAVELGDGEVVAMQEAVRAMRRTRELERRDDDRRQRGVLGKVAAAASLLLVALAQTPEVPQATAGPGPTYRSSDARFFTGSRESVAMAALPTAIPAAFGDHEPLVEPLGRSPEMLYQAEEGELALVMFVDAELDV